MVDFSAVHYLGLWHASWSLPAWDKFSTGVPAAMWEPPEANWVVRHLAQLQGTQLSVLGPSTLHLFWDLIAMLVDDLTVVYLDNGSYPIARWGVERAAGRGVIVRLFQEHNVNILRNLLAGHPPGFRTIIVCDGISPSSGRLAPLPEYLALLPPAGWLVVDDTQALGLLGSDPSEHNPYGCGGGGSGQLYGLRDERLVLLSSLAKGFGVPLAALSGSARLVEWFRMHSETRVHCSPPAQPEILAAMNAMHINAYCGDILRRRLARRVLQFQALLSARGFATTGGLFPVQTLKLSREIPLVPTFVRLQRAGLHAVLRRCSPHDRPCLSFVITARHTHAEIEWAVRTIATVLMEATDFYRSGLENRFSDETPQWLQDERWRF